MGLFKKFILSEDIQKKISLQNALDQHMFGPVWHGTSEVNRQKIKDEGFKVIHGDVGGEGISHGYSGGEYAHGLGSPPVHHLGYGIYLTTSKTIAKMFNHNSVKGLTTYYIDVPKDRLATINFASPRKMMEWWKSYGFDPKSEDRIESTKAMTENLKKKFDAVWFKGKGLHRLLDGDQIVVFDSSRIYEIDKSLTKPGDIGSKVIAKEDIQMYEMKPGYETVKKGDVGILLGRRDNKGFEQYHDGASELLAVNFGGKKYQNVRPNQVEFVGA